MWFTFEARMPYYGDSDYLDSLVTSVKQRLGNVPIDITSFEYNGTIEVNVSQEVAIELSRLPQVGLVYSSGDREMLCSPRTYV
jgi:hypothetical protein